MKLRKVMMLAIIMMAGFIVMPNVSAKTLDEFKATDGVADNNSSGQNYNLKLTKEVKAYITIDAGQTLTLDLDGNNLKNEDESAQAVIWIKQGGILTLKDSKNSGVISVDNNNVNTPIIANEGSMTMNGGKIISSRKGSVAILNDTTGSLDIYGGEITAEGDDVATAAEGSWGITNKGKASIHGGTFTQEYQLSIIQNEKSLIIDGGTFELGSGSTHFSMITNNADSEPTLIISGGEFNAAKVLSSSGNNANTKVIGGDFQDPSNIEEYIPEGYELKDGQVVEIKQPVEESKPAEEAAEKNVDTSDINLVLIISVLVLGVCGVVYTVKKKFY